MADDFDLWKRCAVIGNCFGCREVTIYYATMISLAVSAMAFVSIAPKQATAQQHRSYSLSEVSAIASEKKEISRLCGPLALARVLQKLGYHCDFQRILADFGDLHEGGVPLSRIVDVASKYGERARVLKFSKTDLEQLPSETILLLDEESHCVVLEQFHRGDSKVTIWDPSNLQSVKIPLELLKSKWQGSALVLDGFAASDQIAYWLSVSAIVMGLFFIFLIVTRRALGRRSTDLKNVI